MLQGFIYSLFHVLIASAIMVLHKRMCVRGCSICTCVCAQNMHYARDTQHSHAVQHIGSSPATPLYMLHYAISRSHLIPCVKRQKVHILQHARQGRTLDYSPIELMLASSIVARNVHVTAPRVCTLVLVIHNESLLVHGISW